MSKRSGKSSPVFGVGRFIAGGCPAFHIVMGHSRDHLLTLCDGGRLLPEAISVEETRRLLITSCGDCLTLARQLTDRKNFQCVIGIALPDRKYMRDLHPDPARAAEIFDGLMAAHLRWFTEPRIFHRYVEVMLESAMRRRDSADVVRKPHDSMAIRSRQNIEYRVF
jgi:hypothetical protein